MENDDERLAALIDNELDEDEKNALLERLARDEGLRDRLAALRRDRDRLVASFDALLAQAPVDRLRAAIPPAAVEPAARAGRRRIAWLDLAAGIVVGLLAAGAASWIGLDGLVRGERESWRAAVLEYMDLYTPDTFASANADAAVQAGQLQAVSAKVGVDITPDKIAIPGLHFRTALNLSYDGSPLAEIAYTDASGAPALFCVIADGKPNAPPQAVADGGLSYVAWSRGGKSYMFVAHMPERQVADLAQGLVARF